MAASRKKVILRTLDQTVQAGYLPASGLLDEHGDVALLTLEGRVVPVPLGSVLWIAYVRDFNLADRVDPERLTRRVFLARPRTEGVWLRLTLVGGELLEGLAPLDAGLADGLLEDRGLYLTPPDIRSNTQRMFVPRTAFTAMQVVGVITTPSKAPVAAKAPGAPPQKSLFP